MFGSRLVSIKFDNTFKVKDYDYNFTGKIEKTNFELSSPIKNKIFTDQITNIYLSDLKIKTVIKTHNMLTLRAKLKPLP